jgi:hypothetical protein
MSSDLCSCSGSTVTDEYGEQISNEITATDAGLLSVWRRVRIPPPQPRESYMATKREPGAYGCNWATPSLGNVNTETWSPRLGGRTQGCRTTLLSKKNVIKSKEVKTGCNLAESS